VRSRRLQYFVLVTVALLIRADARLFAQAEAVSRLSFAGEWVLDYNKMNKGIVEDLTVTISKDDSEIRIIRRSSVAGRERVDLLVYFADGRGETNLVSDRISTDEKSEIKSVTKWHDNKLIIRSAMKIKSSQGGALRRSETIEPGRLERWYLSKDGRLHWVTSYKFDGDDPLIAALGRVAPVEDVKRVFRRK
jgi:hypothetical protein